MLLAVDLGLQCGFALYGRDGKLVRYRSSRFANVGQLKRGAYGVLKEIPQLQALVVEGDKHLAKIWESAATRRGAQVEVISAEVWRAPLLLPRQQRSGAAAKDAADALARRVIAWSGAPRPTSLKHDAAEAIGIGLWGVLKRGWLPALPHALRPR